MLEKKLALALTGDKTNLVVFVIFSVSTEDISISESRTKLNSKRSKKKKETEADLEFTAFIGKEMTDILAPPRNPKSLFLSVNRS